MTGRSPIAVEHDIAIVGGGMVGLAAALALARIGARVCVVDALAPSAQVDPAFDGRASAIAYANFRMLERLGVGTRLRANAQRIETILVTDGRAPDGLSRGGPGPAWLRFDAREIDDRPDGEPLGYMVENRQMLAALGGAVLDRPGIDHIAPAEVVSARVEGRVGEVRLADGRVVRAGLVIGADGARSRVRRDAGVRTVGWSYPQRGLVATVRHGRPHGGVAHEYFLPAGPFAILPLTGDRASLVWTEKAAAADAAVRLGDAAFAAEVRRRFGSFLGEVELEGPRWSYPLDLQVAERFVAPRIALIGDAARRIHPIAGQGFNLGLKDVAALTDVVAEARELGLDPGALDVLERYQRWRRFDSLALAAATDLFNRLYSNNAPFVRAARDLGMAAINRAPAARRWFARDAGADLGELPTLLQPVRD
ncbi:MAG: UbiH/UbiF/VisC/COQ6 family ubiquinone biosynthesis hydroxylase [Caulobacterales bacterium]|nr:UbiH/UbiF/VisC/COQ6 family ubiquinone biosynthesis hydroxylase [Caulobacterales bacterium]